MTNKHEEKVEAAVAASVKKVGAKKENDICRFLPGPKGGYIHHFSMRKMKHEAPEDLLEMLNKYILHPASPSKLPPKPRAPRGSRKRSGHPTLTKQEYDLLRFLALQNGQKEIVRKLTPKKDIRTIKRELIASIKHGHVKEELWQSYCETVSSLQQFNGAQAAQHHNATPFATV